MASRIQKDQAGMLLLLAMGFVSIAFHVTGTIMQSNGYGHKDVSLDSEGVSAEQQNTTEEVQTFESGLLWAIVTISSALFFALVIVYGTTRASTSSDRQQTLVSFGKPLSLIHTVMVAWIGSFAHVARSVFIPIMRVSDAVQKKYAEQGMSGEGDRIAMAVERYKFMMAGLLALACWNALMLIFYSSLDLLYTRMASEKNTEEDKYSLAIAKTTSLNKVEAASAPLEEKVSIQTV